MPRIGVEEERRTQVMNAVVKCLLNDGIEKITLDKTAAAAGVSKGVIIYYFKSKKQLLLDTYEYFLRLYFHCVEINWKGDESDYSPEDLLLVIGKTVLGIEEPMKTVLGLSKVQINEIIAQLYIKTISDEDFRSIFCNMYSEYEKAIIEVIDYGKSLGMFEKVETRQAALQLMAMLEGFILFNANAYVSDMNIAYNSYKSFIQMII